MGTAISFSSTKVRCAIGFGFDYGSCVWDFIEARNPDAAELVSSKILRAVEGLLRFLKRGKPGRVKETRELVVLGLPYVVVYGLGGGRVVILRVLPGAQDWPS